MIRLEFVAVVLMAAPVLADPPQPAIVDAVADIYRPFPLDQQKIGGIVGARLRANSEGYIEHIKAPSNTADDQSGTLLDAAVYAFEYNHDAQVNAVMLRLARTLMASQASDGYLGTRSNTEKWTEQDTRSQSADLLGLLNYYRLTGDPSALSASTKLGDLFVKERRKGSGSDVASFASALESMAYLFRYTDNNRYIEFCNAVAAAWLRAKPSELAGTYDNLVVLNGLVELYRINGDDSIFKLPLQAWSEMHAAEFTLTRTSEEDPGNQSQSLSACTTAAWMHLSANLLRITGQAVYAEQLERTVYNQLFAGQDARTGAVLAPVAWSGKKEPANNGACPASEVRALAELPFIAWGRYGNGVAVNLYTNGRATVRLRRRGTIHLYTETDYPESGTVLLHVEPDHPIHFPLRLRVPDWTTRFTADVEADHLVGKAGDFLTINRAWKRGDTVKISMVMNVRAIPGIREFSADVAIARGPQLLALGKTRNPDIKNWDAVRVDPNGLQLASLPTNDAANWIGDQAYELSGIYEDHPKKLIFVPFSNALDYRVWLAQPKASAPSAAR